MNIRPKQEPYIPDLKDRVLRLYSINPEDGDVIPGTGGIRKVRWGKTGMGKRGGVRVIYFYHNADMPLYLLLAYAKSQATDLTPDEKRALTALATAFTQGKG